MKRTPAETAGSGAASAGRREKEGRRVVAEGGQEGCHAQVGAGRAAGDAEVVGETGQEVQAVRVGRVVQGAVPEVVRAQRGGACQRVGGAHDGVDGFEADHLVDQARGGRVGRGDAARARVRLAPPQGLRDGSVVAVRARLHGEGGVVGDDLGQKARRAVEVAPYVDAEAGAAYAEGRRPLTREELPLFVTDTLTRRCGSEEAAHDFVRQVDLRGTAEALTRPLLVVEGATDTIPGVANGEALAKAAPHGSLLSVPYGDHLLGNARPDWLPATADWLAEHRGSARDAG